MKRAPLALLLDDDDAIARLCLRLLQGKELTLITAGTIAQARWLAKSQRFDLLLCDLGLPDGDGLDFVAHFKAEYPAVPAIVMTGAPRRGQAERAAGLGVARFLLKPFNTHEIKEAVRAALASPHEIQRRNDA
ncbi:MAG: response regulator [Elusimicrobia bacterium]|nr:response regulator [Elusimicrobiota bacterium]